MKAERGKMAKSTAPLASVRRARSSPRRTGRRAHIEAGSPTRRRNASRREGDAEASRIYAAAFSQNPAFYKFLRTLQAYEEVRGREHDAVSSRRREVLRMLHPQRADRRPLERQLATAVAKPNRCAAVSIASHASWPARRRICTRPRTAAARLAPGAAMSRARGQRSTASAIESRIPRARASRALRRTVLLDRPARCSSSLGAYFATGFYVVNADEHGVVRRFGAIEARVGPGMHYRLPWPVDRVDVLKTTSVMKVGVGFALPENDSPDHDRRRGADRRHQHSAAWPSWCSTSSCNPSDFLVSDRAAADAGRDARAERADGDGGGHADGRGVDHRPARHPGASQARRRRKSWTATAAASRSRRSAS